jgi:predicted flavoprotein YhiN
LFKEIEKMKIDILNKVSQSDIEQQLLLKANKQSVANALQRKANRAELDAIQKLVSSIDPILGNKGTSSHQSVSGLSQTFSEQLSNLAGKIDDSKT